jgi:hypothetical protein
MFFLKPVPAVQILAIEEVDRFGGLTSRPPYNPGAREQDQKGRREGKMLCETYPFFRHEQVSFS